MQQQNEPTKNTGKVSVDIHQRVTNTIISYLEEGTTPWQKPWVGGDSSFKIPRNMVSDRQYNGINILLLWGATMKYEYDSNEWASFRQWNKQKESIRKGEKGTMVVYYDFTEKEEDGELKRVPFMKSYVVFNRCQLQSYQSGEEKVSLSKPLAERLEHVENYISNTQAVIKHKGKSACFVPSKDEILMPKIAAFTDTEHSTATENYYSTLLHELVHWSGHPDRLDRSFSKRFGDQTYAAEELVAELGAAFLCAELEITREPRKDHANYIANWLTALKNNKYLVTTAANTASKAVSYLHDLQLKPN
ncbi:MAG: zincin-like metallopeptidase domain-containing protein [Flavipsychrobacter sp.]